MFFIKRQFPYIMIALISVICLVSGITSAVSAVVIRPDGFLLVDGQPFIPIGIYAVPVDIDDNTLTQMRDSGINLIYPGPIPLRSYNFPGKWLKLDQPNPVPSESDSDYVTMINTFLNRLQPLGLKALVCPKKFEFDMDTRIGGPSSRESRRQQISSAVTALKDNPALAAWATTSEPEITVCTDMGIDDGYDTLKSVDTQHPVWMVHAPALHSIELVSIFNKGTDIAGYNIFPVPVGVGHSYLDNQDLSCVGDYTDRAEATGKPVWMVLQLCKWSGITGSRMPTCDELRFMTYDALVHGATGILYWQFNAGFADKTYWGNFLKLTKEVKDLSPALMAKPADSSVSAVVYGSGVKWISRRLNDKMYVFAVSDAKGTVMVNWTFNQGGTQSVTELSTGKTWSTASFQDSLEKNSVRIYQLTAANTISGIVTEAETGNPIPNAVINISDGTRLVTDASGSYSVPLFAGTYMVTVSSANRESQSINVTITNGDNLTGNFALIYKPEFTDSFDGTNLDTSKWRTVSGMVSVHDGVLDVSSASVLDTNSSSNPYIFKLASAAKPVRAEFRLRYAGNAADETEVDFGFRNGAAFPTLNFQRHVFSNGSDFWGAVSADSDKVWTINQAIPTTAVQNGRFNTYSIIYDPTISPQSVDFLINGTEVLSSAMSGNPIQELPLNISDGLTGKLPFTVDWIQVSDSNTDNTDGNISGVVKNLDTGLPIPGAAISIINGATAVTDTNGCYMLSVHPGVYTITVNAAGFPTRTVNVTVGDYADVTTNFLLSGKSVTITSPAGFIRKGWNLISLPLQPVDGSPETVLSGIDMSSASLQTWNNASQTGGGYLIYNQNWFAPMKTGETYWFMESGDKTLSYQAYAVTCEAKMIIIPAHDTAPYWAMIGHPFNQKIACDNISFTVDGITKKWGDAVKAGWIEAIMQGWDASGQQYFIAGMSSNPAVNRGYLEPWCGYWVLVKANHQLIITIPTSPTMP